MGLEELLDRARHTMALGPHGTDEREYVTCQAIIDMLGEGSLCGYEAPMVLDGPAHARVRIPESWGSAMLSADETRALAGQLLRAADEADGGAK